MRHTGGTGCSGSHMLTHMEISACIQKDTLLHTLHTAEADVPVLSPDVNTTEQAGKTRSEDTLGMLDLFLVYCITLSKLRFKGIH